MYNTKIESYTFWSPESDDGKYVRHRIPGIVVTKKDTIIAYCEARTLERAYSLKNQDDWTLMDIYIQRSDDHGKTFGEPIYVARGDENHAAVNNPVIIVGNDNTLHLLYCKNYSIRGGGLWYKYSIDDGITWSEERDISDSVPFAHDCFAFGPTHGICTRDGKLMTAVWYVPYEAGDMDTTHGPSRVAVFYSIDNGKTWAIGENARRNTNETDIVELSDGSIMLNSRAFPYRKVTVSPDGIGSWSDTYADQQLPDPGCCGGLVSVNLPGHPYGLLFVNCADNISDRARHFVTVKYSDDDGKTWNKSLQLTGYNKGGYADIAIDSNGKVYVLYEIEFGKYVELATFDFSDAFEN